MNKVNILGETYIIKKSNAKKDSNLVKADGYMNCNNCKYQRKITGNYCYCAKKANRVLMAVQGECKWFKEQNKWK